MRVLAIGGTHVAVALWRIIRPARQLQKSMPEWEIEFQDRLVESLTEDQDKTDFTEVELENAARNLGSYDIVFLSYHILTGVAYSLLMAITQRHGTKFVIDFDDNIFAVNEDNPIWLTVSHERMHELQIIARVHPHITVSTRQLAEVLRTRRTDHPSQSVSIIQNFIPDNYKSSPPNNSPRVVVGYFGGSSHFADVHESGFPKAMRDIMREHPEVDFRAAGVPLDIPMASGRESFIDGIRGEGWVTDIFPKLGMDIVVAPLLHNVFNFGKSNIKWQEATRAGAAVIASNVGPYAALGEIDPDRPSPIYLVPNTRAAWHEAIKDLVQNEQTRRGLVATAQRQLASSWRLEDHWQLYRDYFSALKVAR